jgi:pimeloyl-ACP methyl ester carboxylesterase
MLGGFLPKDHRQRAHVRDMYALNDPKLMGQFVREFYNDADPRVDLLREIECPTMVMVGADDDALLEPSRLMASEIPGATLVELPGVGHMTAIEAPHETGDALVDLYTSAQVEERLGTGRDHGQR